MNLKNIKPLDYWVLIRQDPIQDKEGSILLPDDMKEKNLHGQIYATVVSVGSLAFSTGEPGTDKHRFNPEAPKPGDRIIFRKYAGTHFIDDGEDDAVYRLIEDNDVKAVIHD